ncbi:(deoxy)nucleoside triphosphate pyrophosphohydrolase [Propionispora hippei]|uniref:8-oxo-dGTP diphosphatase n=1 Tax=Propionispora hippei DSM 15287 TaxID=1123003 RepID=A0A1M6I7K1_9FIRM|nr:(deoxy)nucleoside triphosphate pyrophosphohydrolase [Propionispora hippei]SHJ30420.1 8-oxo-dGTP diphosphatase [Propionispora hippei DSM 15287]
MRHVTAAVLLKDGKCLIAKRRTGDALENLWEFPGGKIEDGETPQECLQREIREELQIEVTVGDFLTESIYDYGRGVIRLMAYIVTWQNGNLRLTVHDGLAWVDRNTITGYPFAPADIPIAAKVRDLLSAGES